MRDTAFFLFLGAGETLVHVAADVPEVEWYHGAGATTPPDDV
eukprot:SAG11_NODE_9138_length_939_cov_1.295238_2_plen_41_part_01